MKHFFFTVLVVSFFFLNGCTTMFAEMGNAGAQIVEGDIALENNDYSGALEWYKKAEDGASSQAKWRIASLYEHGYGVEKNLEKARQLYIESAHSGNPEGLRHAGKCFEEGIGGDVDLYKALSYYKDAHEALYKYHNTYDERKMLQEMIVDVKKKIRHKEAATAPHNMLNSNNYEFSFEKSRIGIYYLKFMCKYDDIRIIDIILNKGNYQRSNDFPKIIKFGESFTETYPNTQPILSIEIITDRGRVKKFYEAY